MQAAQGQTTVPPVTLSMATPPKAPEGTPKPVTPQLSGFEKKGNQWVLVIVGTLILLSMILSSIFSNNPTPTAFTTPQYTQAQTQPPAAQPQPRKPRYQYNGDGTVTDGQTGRQWMRCALGQTWQRGTCIGEAEKYDWQAAQDAANALNRQGGYAGYRDWRVPTIEELRTLIYCSSGQPKTWNDTGESCEGDYQRPTIYQPAFPNTPLLWYWSSSTYAGNPDKARLVNFLFGNVLADNKGSSLLVVRLVRGGQ